MAGVSSKKFYRTCHFFPCVTFIILVMTTCQHCQQTFGRTNSLTLHLWEKQSQNQIRTVSLLHKDFFPRRTLSASPPNSTQPSVTKLTMSRLPKQDLRMQRPPTRPPKELPCPTKGRQSKRGICNVIFPARGHWTKRAICSRRIFLASA